MSRAPKKRARGRAYPCACGEEKLRLSHAGPDARLEGWLYLWGECGGGVKLSFAGTRFVEARPVEKVEADRVRALPARRVEPYAAMLERVDAKARERLDAIISEIRDAIQDGMKSWVATGQLLAEAKNLLKKGDFGLWVQRNGMDPHNAYRLIGVYAMVRALPAFSSTLRKIGQEKTLLIARLPEAKRVEVLQDGVPVDGKITSVESVTHRQLNAFVRDVVGKSTRGRKGKAAPAERPKERFGLAIEWVEAFQGALQHLGELAKLGKQGLPTRGRPAAHRFWSNVNHLFFKLQDDLGFDALLEKVPRS